MIITNESAQVTAAASEYWTKAVKTLRDLAEMPDPSEQYPGSKDMISKADVLFHEMIEAMTEHRHRYARWQVEMTFLYIQRMLGTVEAAINVARCQSIPVNHRRIAVTEIMDDATEQIRFNLVF